MSLHIKKGDNVVVIAGKDKNKTGNVVSANPSDNTVVVSGVNMISKHQKPRKAGEKGGIMKREGKIDSSNVQILCPACGKATRVAHKLDGDNKVRVCKKCGESLDSKPAKKEVAKKATTTKKATAEKKETVAKKSTTKKTTKKSDKE